MGERRRRQCKCAPAARLPSLPAVSTGTSGFSKFFGKEVSALALTRLAADAARAPARLRRSALTPCAGGPLG